MDYSVLKEELKNTINQIFPKLDGFSEIISDSSSILRGLSKAHELIIVNKFKIFVNNLESITKQDIYEFIDEIKDNEQAKTIFIESINKTIDLDDTLQIFILTNLVKSYKENGKFEYEEKKLYYNIKQFSEDDFTIYYCFYKKYILSNEKQKQFSVKGEIINKQLVEVIIKNFISYNILQDSSYINTGKQSSVSLSFKLTDYSEKLFNMLDIYFKKKDDLCTSILPIKKNHNKIHSISFIV